MIPVLDVTFSNEVPNYVGPAYLRFSKNQVALTAPSRESDDVVVDLDRDGKVVGVEIVHVDGKSLGALMRVARRYDLDLTPVFEMASRAA